jgi:hypothetical protein
MNRYLCVFVCLFVAGVQAQGPVLAWAHTGPVESFQVRIDGKPPIKVGVPPRDTTGRYVWELPASLSTAAHSFIVEACNVLNVCTPSVTLSVPARTSKSAQPTTVKFEQTATGRLGTGLPTGTATGNGGVLPLPGAITNMMPANGAIDVSITPTLSFASTNATGYFLFLGIAGGSSPDLISLPNGASYSPTLLNDTSYGWQACATNSIGTTCSSVFVFTTIAAAAGSAPANVAITFPLNGATGASITPTASCTADNADTFVIKFGTTNPPTTPHSLGADCSYPTGTLSYSTTYYLQAVATNVSGSTSSSVSSFTTRADPGPAAFCSRPCQRLLLTSSRKTELSTRRTNNTAEWQQLKSYADVYVPDSLATFTTLSASLGTGGVGTTFTVTSGSAFPSASTFQVRIDVELMSVTRSGNTFTVVSRGDILYAHSMGAQTHASGAEVWWHSTTVEGYGLYAGPVTAMMEHIGQSGYTDKARALFGQMMLAYSPTCPGSLCERHNLNTVRPAWWAIAITYDWIRGHLSANEISVYAPILEETARWHLDNLKWCLGGCVTDQGVLEASVVANLGLGQLRAALALSAAVYGDASGALVDWTDAYQAYNDYFVPSLATGAFSGGNEPEGTEYMMDVWWMAPTVLHIVNSAIGEDSWGRVPGWESKVAKYMLYSTQPSGRGGGSQTTTVGNGVTTSTTLTVTDASSFAIGDYIYVTTDGHSGRYEFGAMTVDAVTNTDVLPAGHTPISSDVGGWVEIQPLAYGDNFAPGYYTITALASGKWRLNASPAAPGASTTWWQVPTYYYTVIVDKSGNTLTLRDPLPFTVTNGAIGHKTGAFAYGDTETYNNWDEYEYLAESAMGADAVSDILRTTNPSYASYLKWFNTHDEQFVGANGAGNWPRFMFRDPAVSSVDYTGASLPTIYSTAASAGNSSSTGMLIGLSNWTKTATWVNFLVGGEMGQGFDHATHYMNSYTFKRKGVFLSSNLHGYGATNLHDPPPHLNDQGLGYGSSPFVGWRYHNTIAMNGHGASIFSGFNPTGPAVLSRSDVQTTYFYGRGNAGDLYRYNGNNARIFQRDFFYLKPDLIAFADYVTYAASSTSPTTWFLQFAGNPSLSSQRITSTYAGQKLVQDVLLPTSGVFTKVTHSAEDSFIKGFRYEIQSGVSASTEYFCSVAQGMDSGDTPLSVTSLTTTNACVMEVAAGSTVCPNACVVGFVKGSTPTLPISWTYSAAAPDSYIFGLAPSTAYHITRATKTVTIATATGSGDTTSSASGKLAVP